ncbi:MAG: HxlR family transcriptional regulator [Acidimicrobiaceae bacterium]|nr:HxlR family transcriptional regulator [Acidimicrobiaceae bacterium]
MSATEPTAESTTSAGLTRALERVGDRWTLLAVAALLDGPRRFGELGLAMPGISTNVLTSRLRALEQSGVVIATAYTNRPPRYEYELTDVGRDLAGAIQHLAVWGARAGQEGENLVHRACSTPLEVRYFCPICNEVVDEPDEVWI